MSRDFFGPLKTSDVILTGTVLAVQENVLDGQVTAEELSEALTIALKYSHTSYDVNCVTAVNKTAAQQLREQANYLETKDKEIQQARIVLATYNKNNNKEGK